jgi:hypothetical protein
MTRLGKEYVCAFDVSVYNLDVVKSVESNNHLVQYAPYLFFLHEPVRFLEVVDLGLKVAAISVLHHDAESLRAFLKECLLVCDDVGMVDGCQDSDLIQSIVFLLIIQFAELDLSGWLLEAAEKRARHLSSLANLPF